MSNLKTPNDAKTLDELDCALFGHNHPAQNDRLTVSRAAVKEALHRAAMIGAKRMREAAAMAGPIEAFDNMEDAEVFMLAADKIVKNIRSINPADVVAGMEGK